MLLFYILQYDGLSTIQFKFNKTCSPALQFNLRVQLHETVTCQELQGLVLTTAITECTNNSVFRYCSVANQTQVGKSCDFLCKCPANHNAECKGVLFMHPDMSGNELDITELFITEG